MSTICDGMRRSARLFGPSPTFIFWRIRNTVQRPSCCFLINPWTRSWRRNLIGWGELESFISSYKLYHSKVTDWCSKCKLKTNGVVSKAVWKHQNTKLKVCVAQRLQAYLSLKIVNIERWLHWKSALPDLLVVWIGGWHIYQRMLNLLSWTHH